MSPSLAARALDIHPAAARRSNNSRFVAGSPSRSSETICEATSNAAWIASEQQDAIAEDAMDQITWSRVQHHKLDRQSETALHRPLQAEVQTFDGPRRITRE